MISLVCGSMARSCVRVVRFLSALSLNERSFSVSPEASSSERRFQGGFQAIVGESWQQQMGADVLHVEMVGVKLPACPWHVQTVVGESAVTHDDGSYTQIEWCVACSVFGSKGIQRKLEVRLGVCILFVKSCLEVQTIEPMKWIFFR